MNRLIRKYLIYTFSIMVVCWGLCVICSMNGVSLSKNYLLYLPYMLGGWSPTIASFIALKQEKEISGVKDWLGHVFDFRHNGFSYLMVAVLCVLFIAPQCLVAGYENGAPLFAIVLMIPVMLFGGGLEEAGWRYILQPELEKKLGFTISTLIVSLIWWLWHLPLFYIEGVSQYGGNYLAFGINVLGISFALAGIRKITGSVWLCVLFHCTANSLSGIFLIHETIWGNIAAAAVLIAASCVLIKVNDKKRIFQ